MYTSSDVVTISSLFFAALFYLHTHTHTHTHSPRAQVWELGEEDEGIQVDVQSMRSRTSSTYAPVRTSTASIISGISTGACVCVCGIYEECL